MADGNFARRPTRFPKANSHGKKGLEASEEPMPRCRTEEGGRHMAGITDVSMFLPFMARRTPEPMNDSGGNSARMETGYIQ